MLFQPADCQIPEITYTGTNALGEPSRLTDSDIKCIFFNNPLITPVDGDNKICSIATNTTVEIKYGIYTAVWMTFFNFFCLKEFMINARKIGAGNPHIKVKNEITNVLRSVGQNIGLEKYCIKYLNPTQSPPVNPFENHTCEKPIVFHT